MQNPRLENAVHRIDRTLKRLTLTSIFRTKKCYSPHGYAYASFHRRLMAMTLDAFMVMLILMPFNEAILAFAYKGIQLDPALVNDVLETATSQAELNMRMFKLQMDAGFGAAFAYQLQIQFAVFAAYSMIFWHFYAATPGKLLLGMRIVDEKTGERIGFFHSFFRIFAYIFSALPLMFGFFMIGMNRKKRGFHDWFAGTSVIVFTDKEVKDAPPITSGQTP